MAGRQLRVSVISPERKIFEGPADQVVVPAWDGERGILRGHAPLLSLLGDGQVRVKSAGSEQTFTISGGFLQVADDVVTILSERAV